MKQFKTQISMIRKYTKDYTMKSEIFASMIKNYRKDSIRKIFINK